MEQKNYKKQDDFSSLHLIKKSFVPLTGELIRPIFVKIGRYIFPTKSIFLNKSLKKSFYLKIKIILSNPFKNYAKTYFFNYWAAIFTRCERPKSGNLARFAA